MISGLRSVLMSCQSDLGAHLSTILLETSAKLRDVGNATDGVSSVLLVLLQLAVLVHIMGELMFVYKRRRS
jgi:hypothetical protein